MTKKIKCEPQKPKKPKSRAERLMEEADYRCRNPKPADRGQRSAALASNLKHEVSLATTDFPKRPVLTAP